MPTEVACALAVTTTLAGRAGGGGAGGGGDEVPNVLTNPGVEIWQRGPGGFNANTGSWTLTADRWRILVTGTSALAVSRVAADAGQGSLYALGFTYTQGTAGNQGRISQRIEGWQQLAGRQVAFSAFVKSSVVGAVRILVNDGATDTTSAPNAGTTGEVLSVVASIPAGAAIVDVRVIFDQASVNGYVDSLVLVPAGSPVPYTPLHQALDFVQCQRTYAVLGGLSATEDAIVLECLTATTATGVWRYPVEMAGTPSAVTISAAADWSVTNAAGGAVACTALAIGIGYTARAARINATVAAGLVAGNAALLVAANANARIWAEYNP